MIMCWIAFALCATILTEYGMLLLMGEKRKKVLKASVAMNVLTNVPLNLYLTMVDGGMVAFLIGEILVVVIEALCYEALVRKPSQAMAYSVLCNAVSCLFGILVQLLGMIVGIL